MTYFHSERTQTCYFGTPQPMFVTIVVTSPLYLLGPVASLHPPCSSRFVFQPKTNCFGLAPAHLKNIALESPYHSRSQISGWVTPEFWRSQQPQSQPDLGFLGDLERSLACAAHPPLYNRMYICCCLRIWLVVNIHVHTHSLYATISMSWFMSATRQGTTNFFTLLCGCKSAIGKKCRPMLICMTYMYVDLWMDTCIYPLLKRANIHASIICSNVSQTE